MPTKIGTSGLLALVLLGAGNALSAQSLQLPKGFANVYSYSTENQYPEGCGPSSYSEGTSSASATRTCTFSGMLGQPPADLGNFTTSGSASFVQGQSLHAHATLSGTLAPGVFMYNDAYTGFSDAMTITGPITPSSVVFRLAIEGTFSNPGNNDANPTFHDNFYESGRVDMDWWQVNPDGTIVNGSNLTGIGLEGLGDGSTETMDVTVPWAMFDFNNTFAYQLSLVAFARAVNRTNAPLDVYVDSDYGNTARIQSYTVYDAAGNDITPLEDISFASAAVTATPEPASLTLLATGLVGVFGAARRRRKAR